MEPGSPARRSQEIGDVADDFKLRNVNGGEASLSGFLEGKKGAVVIFWSGVCSHCVRYDAYLNGFAEQSPGAGLRGGGVAAGRNARSDPRDHGGALADLPDPARSQRAVAQRWSTQQTPRAFLLDAGRAILYRGAIDNFKYPNDPEYAAYLEPAIAEFLAGKPVQRTETASFGCAIQSVYYILPKSL